jgi:hypothetical protein
MRRPALPNRHIDASEQGILASATQQTAAVEPNLGALRPRVQIDPAAARRSRELTLERERFLVAIARAREVLRSCRNRVELWRRRTEGSSSTLRPSPPSLHVCGP